MYSAVDYLFHRGRIVLNEEGAEAAAVSGGIGVRTCEQCMVCSNARMIINRLVFAGIIAYYWDNDDKDPTVKVDLNEEGTETAADSGQT